MKKIIISVVHFYGAGIRISPKNGLFGVERLNMLEIKIRTLHEIHRDEV